MIDFLVDILADMTVRNIRRIWMFAIAYQLIFFVDFVIIYDVVLRPEHSVE